MKKITVSLFLGTILLASVLAYSSPLVFGYSCTQEEYDEFINICLSAACEGDPTCTRTVTNYCIDATNQVCTSISGGFESEITGKFDFKVDIEQNSITVLQGGDPVEVVVEVFKIRGESKQVLLTVTSWQSQDISTKFSDSSFKPYDWTYLSIETTCNTMPDQYLFTVRGETSGTFATSVDSVTLTVKKNEACYYPDIPNENVALSAFNKGFDLFEMGDNEKAVRYLDNAIDLFPEYTEALDIRGILLNKLGKYDESIRSFDAAIESDPNNPKLYNNKGVTLKLQGKYSEALESLNQALEINPNYEIALEQKRIVENLISDERGGGCLIATATFGSELAPQVQQLRELRDNTLLNTESGTSFMSTFNDVYYSFSPIIADYERENPVFKEMVKIAITPMITSLSILNYVDMDSEAEVLGYGISLILLNIGMYVGIPAVVIVGIRKRL